MSAILETVRADDFIEYFLFPNLNSNAAENNECNLDNVILEINKIIEKYCREYIWHKDEFRLTPRYANSNLLLENQADLSEPLPPHIYGISFVDDNIQDEWFIVSLLFEITKKMPGLVARCVDSDGEFILIEAADHLPEWANPETCEQRMFIVNGEMHLIKNSVKGISSSSANLPISVGLNELRNNPTKHKVSNEITKCIQERIKGLPADFSALLHRANVYVPVSAAALLKHKPSLVAASVRAICNRDQIDTKACRAMKYFPPENRVKTNVVFTKFLYAMLVHNNYTPDRRTGWNLPMQNHESYKPLSLGVKLACGFEILASQAKTPENFDSNRNWLNYLESLKKRGYFQENLEGSKDYTRLLESAKEYFRNNIDSMPYSCDVGNEILASLKSLDISADDFKKRESELPESDSEDWLNVSEGDLDNMLASRYGINKVLNTNGNIDPSELTGHLTDFLNKKSDFDGVNTAQDDNAVLPVAAKRSNKKKGSVRFSDHEIMVPESESPSTRHHIDFNPDEFVNHVQHMLDLVIPEDNWESNSDMSDFDEEEDLEQQFDKMGNANSLKAYMDQMDKELAKTTLSKSFENGAKPSAALDDSFEDIEDFKPVNIDVNTLKNIAQSYQSQYGGPGPASSLLGSMGIHIQPTDANKQEDKNLYNSEV